MPVTSGISGFGTTLSWNGTALAELKKIGGPKISVSTIPMTNHGSPSGFAEFVGGVGDGGEVSISGNLIAGDTAGANAMITDMIAKTIRAVVITGPGSLFTWSFNALCTGYEPTLDFDANLSFTATFKVTGVPTFGYTSAPQLTALSITTTPTTLFPTFAAGTYIYQVQTSGTSFTVTPTCATADNITVNGSTVVSGNASSAIAIAGVGTIVTVTIVCIKAGMINRTYTITVTKTS